MKNTMKPATDIAVRKFFKVIVEDETFLAKLPATRREIINGLLTALNYDWLPNGAFVPKGTNITMKYGQSDFSSIEDQWPIDEERALEALKDTDTTEASASEPTEDTEVREAVLSEDV